MSYPLLRAHEANLFHSIAACLSYPDYGSGNTSDVSQSPKGCISSWSIALSPSELAGKLIQSIDLKGDTPSAEYKASVVSLSQGAEELRTAGLFNPTAPFGASVILAVGALIMAAFFVALHFQTKSIRISYDFILLLGAICDASSLLFVGGSYFALYRGQAMLSLAPTLPVESGQAVFVAPGNSVLELTLVALVLAAAFTVLIGFMAFQRYGKDRSKTPKAKPKGGDSSKVPQFAPMFQFHVSSSKV
jgi:hypothetical protein